MRVRGVVRGWRVAGALLLAAAVLLPRLPQDSRSDATFPRVSPHYLAHFLADFSNHAKLDPQIGSWSVEEEQGNYTWWRYSVRYICGARCEGRAHLQHKAGSGGARHGAASDHILRVLDSRCSRLPLMPWPWFCEESEVETRITQAPGGGSQLQEEGRGACGVLRAMSGLCALHNRRQDFLAALGRAL